MIAEHEAMKRLVADAQESAEVLRRRFSQLESEQSVYRNEVSRLKDLTETMQLEKAREMDAIVSKFTSEQEKLISKLESVGEDEKKKLVREIQIMGEEQKKAREKLEERSKKQEEQLKKTLEENERLLKMREQQAAEVRKKQDEAAKGERTNQPDSTEQNLKVKVY